MKHQLFKLLKKARIPGTGDERGQSYLEFIMVFPALVVLFLFIAVYGWYWWNQTTAATAIHDGTYYAAIRYGNRGLGYAETRRALRAALGQSALDYEGKFAIVHYPGMRSTWGVIANESAIRLPYVGGEQYVCEWTPDGQVRWCTRDTIFSIKAMSFQRRERFYGGPPDGWE